MEVETGISSFDLEPADAEIAFHHERAHLGELAVLGLTLQAHGPHAFTWSFAFSVRHAFNFSAVSLPDRSIPVNAGRSSVRLMLNSNTGSSSVTRERTRSTSGT